MKSTPWLLTFVFLIGLASLTASAIGDQKAACGYPINKEGKWGYIDASGKIIIEPRFDWARTFREGLAAVEVGGKWGFVDSGGKVVIPARFDEVQDFSEGLCAALRGGKWGFIEKTGTFRGPRRYECARSFSEGLAAVRTGKKWGFVNRGMKMAIKPYFDGAWSFTEGLAPVKVGSRWGYVDKNGKVVIPPLYYRVDSFSEGLALVEGGQGSEGYIDRQGKLVISHRFYDGNPFSEGVAAVRSEAGGSYYLVDKRGTSVTDPRFRDVGLFSEGLAAVMVGFRFGYIDKAGNTVIKPQFAEAERFSGGMARVHTEDAKLGYIDRTGRFVWGPESLVRGKPVHSPHPQVFWASIEGAPSVPAKAVSCIGNPYRKRFPDGGPSVFSRSIWDMLLFDGRIYVGSGDYWNNTGPVEIYSFAPGQEEFILEYTAPDEMVSKFYDFDGRLVVPGNDPRESWDFGNIYMKESGEWRKVRTLPNGLHCFHLAYLNGNLIAAINTERAGNILLSSDWGRSWTPVVFDGLWAPMIFTFDGRVRAFDDEGRLYILDGDVLFSEEMTPKLEKLKAPSVPRPGFRSYHTALPFSGGVILVTRFPSGSPRYGPHPLFHLGRGQTQASVVSAFAGRNVMDVLVRGDTLYAICARAGKAGFENTIFATNDVKHWRCVVSFTTESFARSFEEAGGAFYVGIGAAGYAREPCPDSTGDILKIVPAR